MGIKKVERSEIRPGRKEKAKLVKDLSEKLSKIKIAILVNYSGLEADKLFDLRDRLEQKEAEFRVVKNTLAKKACEKANIKIDPEFFKGPVAIIFGFSDEVEPAKIVYKFAKIEKKPEILGAIYENESIDKDTVEKLAKIPEKSVLEAQLVGQIQAPITGLVNVLRANLTGLTSILDQYKKQITVNN